MVHIQFVGAAAAAPVPEAHGGLKGSADFYARDVPSLKKEGAASLKVFLEMCEEDDVEPGRHYSGKFNVRIAPELHASIAAAAAAEGKSLNQWVADTFSTHV